MTQCNLQYLFDDGGKFLHQCAQCGKVGRYKYRDSRLCHQQCDANPGLMPMPGYEFRRIRMELKITEKCSGQCGELEAEMNAAGVTGCRARREYFLVKLRANATSYGLLDWAKAGFQAVIQGKPRSLEGLYDLAIERAGQIAALTAKESPPPQMPSRSQVQRGHSP